MAQGFTNYLLTGPTWLKAERRSKTMAGTAASRCKEHGCAMGIGSSASSRFAFSLVLQEDSATVI
jgi:hypothetical protein